MTQLTNGICINQNLSNKMKSMNFLGGFEIQMNHPRQDLELDNKKTCHLMDFTVSANHSLKIKKEAER